MDLVILFDWFTNESIEAALQATEWQQREMFLRLALMWGGVSRHRIGACRCIRNGRVHPMKLGGLEVPLAVHILSA